ncbi:hypothetical protein QKU44_gp1 [Chestnut teal chaphamaparvovirus 2]|uniref:Uncharacterized protein n=1 Tax=Chestnut teal chaphamaparvovirus 2 TaxID=2759404 RepID=A0A7D7B5P7_9VIRU|nr:hypothetical protein QKU44_gp1 [Chestnut teal chaphamaparvovirus 2]QMI57832.1 hypothetical protein [Chestnut teal chaphamaparvovirus 2]
MAGAYVGSSGCSLLVWVDTETTGGKQMEGDQPSNKVKEMLEDACCLLGVRWGIDFTHHTHGGVLYAFGCQPRYTIGMPTINRALGDLAPYVKVHRGGPHDSAEQLIRYQACRAKYNVPETVHEDTYGEGSQANPSQLQWSKKRRS